MPVCLLIGGLPSLHTPRRANILEPHWEESIFLSTKQSEVRECDGFYHVSQTRHVEVIEFVRNTMCGRGSRSANCDARQANDCGLTDRASLPKYAENKERNTPVKAFGVMYTCHYLGGTARNGSPHGIGVRLRWCEDASLSRISRDSKWQSVPVDVQLPHANSGQWAI